MQLNTVTLSEMEMKMEKFLKATDSKKYINRISKGSNKFKINGRQLGS